VVETWPAAQRGRATAFMLSSFPVGGAVAALLAGALLPDWAPAVLPGRAGVVVPLLIVGLLFSESAEWAEQKSTPVRWRSSPMPAPLARWRGVVRVVGFAVADWLCDLLHRRGSTASACFLTVLNLGMFVGYNVFGLIADRIGRKYALLLSLTGVGVTLPLYVVAGQSDGVALAGPAVRLLRRLRGIFGSYLGELFPTGCA